MILDGFYSCLPQVWTRTVPTPDGPNNFLKMSYLCLEWFLTAEIDRNGSQFIWPKCKLSLRLCSLHVCVYCNYTVFTKSTCVFSTVLKFYKWALFMSVSLFVMWICICSWLYYLVLQKCALKLEILHYRLNFTCVGTHQMVQKFFSSNQALVSKCLD